jgi:protocatechuate 3,4-dioxygenase beta subunit
VIGRRNHAGQEETKMSATDTIAPPQAGELQRTPDQILGPFYPVRRKPVDSGDLTDGGRAAGTVLYLSGRVLTCAGKPVAGARVEIWQANAHGRYDHPHDGNPAPLDPHFAGFAVTTSDADGNYAFRTIRPAAYPAGPGRMRPAHIHFSVTAETEQLVTQMYFAGDDWNDRDPWLNSARRKDALIVSSRAAEGKEPGAQRVTFDLVLARG